MPNKVKTKSPLATFNDTKEAIEDLATEILHLCANNFHIRLEDVDLEKVKRLTIYEERLLEVTLHANGNNYLTPRGKSNATTH